MLSKVLIFVLPMVTMGALSGGFNYDRCDATFGPDMWPGACQSQTALTGARGTPIDLCEADPLPALPLITPGYLTRNAEYDQVRTMNVYNDGSSIGLNFLGTETSLPELTTRNLQFEIGTSAYGGFTTWRLQNIHIHWGRQGKYNEGSEHYLEGKAFPAEVHFVHYNTKFASFSAAVSSGSRDALLVVGIFLEKPLLQLLVDPETPLVKNIAAAAPFALKTPQQLSHLVLSNLFDINGPFYTYPGGLTTPGCSELVTWVVMSTPKAISESSLQKIWSASTTPGVPGGEPISKHGNYRPLQLRNGRKVRSFCVSKQTCKPVIEPNFNC